MEKEEEKVILFGPKDGKSLKKLYPEIAAANEFKDLHSDDLLFAWYIGNASSPIEAGLPTSARAVTAASICFPNDKIKRKAYAELAYPEEVKIAIDKMTRFSPDARLISKRMVQTMFHNFQKMVDVDNSEFYVKDKEGSLVPDWTAKKQYIDSCAKISEVLPSLIKQIEEGFGIEESKSGEKKATKAIDRFHKDNNQK